MAEVHADERDPGRAGQLGGAQQAAVTAEHEDELGTVGRLVIGRHLRGARAAELAGQGPHGQAGGHQPVHHQPGTAQRGLPPRVRRHQHRALSH